jgi:hypothetical protein
VISFFKQYLLKVIESLDHEEAASIARAQKCLRDPSLPQKLAYIRTNFGFLVTTIKKLETKGLKMSEVGHIILDAKNMLDAATSEIGEIIRKKFDDVLLKNPGFETMRKIGAFLNGNLDENLDIPANILYRFKYAPVTSVDVERSFSTYKNILSDRRTSFTPENLEYYMISHCASKNI